MPAGPQLPLSLLEKRKRDSEDEDGSSDSDVGPAPPPSTDTVAKKARVLGPTLPPAPLNERPPGTPPKTSNDASESSDDDDFGPRLPLTGPHLSKSESELSNHAQTAPQIDATQTKRDDWMMVPPSGADWGSRADPTKLKNRKFNTGKGGQAPPSGGDASSTWHETPVEKQARLQREMMGIKDTTLRPEAPGRSSSYDVDAETARRMLEYNASCFSPETPSDIDILQKSRGPTLYQAHQKQESAEQEDDPSARAFDREKDIGGGMQINATQRRDMMRKAADFNSRFSSAKYL